MKAIAQARADRHYVKETWKRCGECVHLRALNSRGNNICALDGAPVRLSAWCKSFKPVRRPTCNRPAN